MPRSPLVRMLLAAHRAHRIARETGVPVDEVVAQEEARREALREARALDRRTFLKGAVVGAGVVGAAGVAGSLLSACPPPTPTPAGKKTVGIVGAGMAGLHCAHRLQKLGVTASVYTAEARLGGRMFTDRDTFSSQNGQHCELGGELIDTGHETMRALADEFGLELLDYADDVGVDKIVSYFGGQKVALADILTAYGPIAAAIDADVATIGGDGFVYYNEHNGGEALDALSIKDWFDARGFAEDNVARQLWEVAFNIEYGLETDQQSCLNMLFLTSTDTSEAGFSLFGDSDERFHTKDGNDAFITKLAAALDDGQITTGAVLTKVASESDGRIRLTFDGADDAVHDHVVLAIPFTTLRDVDLTGVSLSDAKRGAIQNLGYGTNAKLMVGFDERVWRQGASPSDGSTYGDNGFQSTWETSRLQAQAPGGDAGIITNYFGGDIGLAAGDGTPADRAAAFLAQWEEVFPGVTAAHNGNVARFHWPTNRFVKASYASYRTGQYLTITGVEIESENDGTLHFCGEHTSLDFQGFMEGAAVTGAAAAVEVADALGVDSGQALLASSPEARILVRARALLAQRRLKAGRGRRVLASAA